MKQFVKQLLTAVIFFSGPAANAQSTMKTQKAGNIFYISVPDYFSRTIGLNSAATVQYQSILKDVYSVVIEDPKETLALDGLKFNAINEFYEEFVKVFVKDKAILASIKPKYQVKDGISFAECEVVFQPGDSMPAIYYLIGMVETKNCFYKVVSWTLPENKDKYREDFQKILYSIRD
jgi:hypothetical protein